MRPEKRMMLTTVILWFCELYPVVDSQDTALHDANAKHENPVYLLLHPQLQPPQRRNRKPNDSEPRHDINRLEPVSNASILTLGSRLSSPSAPTSRRYCHSTAPRRPQPSSTTPPRRVCTRVWWR